MKKELFKLDKKTNITIALVLSLTVLLVIGTVTYAFTAMDDLPNEPIDVTASTAEIKLRYTDCLNEDPTTCGDITAQLEPGQAVEKMFSVSNVGVKDLKYTLYFRELSSTFVDDELVYKLENLTTGTVLIDETPVPTGTNDGEKIIDLDAQVGTTQRFKLTIGYLNKDYNQIANRDAEFSLKLGIKEFEVKTTTIAYGLKANLPSVTNYTDGDTKEMYTFDHDEATQTTGWSAEERRDYRYIGNNPNNYITFNDETWRIIGVFTTELENGSKEQLMKIIRNESLGDLAWDSSSNEWSTSSLKTLLNGDYYNQSGSYSSTSTVKGLNETAREQIENVKWYLGGSSTYQNLGGPNYYSFERGTTVYSGRSTNIVAKVGLMYPSDYVYTYANGVNSKCYTDGYNCDSGTPSAGWLFNSSIYQWTISPNAGLSLNAFSVASDGYVYNTHVYYAGGVRPSVYLKSNIQIKSGTGASNDPYIIE